MTRMPVPFKIRVLHTENWVNFTSQLPRRFFCSSIVLMEVIVTDINDLVQDFWRTRISHDGNVGAPFCAMLHLFEILQGCCDILKVCFDIFPFRDCRRL